jgi:pyruvate dehydrogenase E2 component (dihydrolipoamide acetyltransferase)
LTRFELADGAVALADALEHPDRVASLTLVAPAGLGEDINADYIDGFVAAERRRELKGVLQLLFADQGLVNRKLVDDVLRYKRLDGVEAALRTVAGAMYPSGRQTTVLAGELDRLSAPVLVVWGRAGPCPARRPRPGAGHSPHMEAANDVNRLVGGFLNEQEGEPT